MYLPHQFIEHQLQHRFDQTIRRNYYRGMEFAGPAGDPGWFGPDSVTGRISDERFAELSADYEAEQRQLKERAAELQGELAKAQEATVNAEKFMNIVRKYTSFEELTPTLLREFIEKIVVHECSYDENKNRRQEIEIYYSFVGKVDLPE